MTDLPPFVIAVGPASDPRPGLQLRVAPEHLMEVTNELKREEVLLGFPIYASSVAGEMTAVLASTAGGLHGIATVIKALASRHQHRHVVLTNRDGDTLELTALPPEEMEKYLTQFLGEQQGKQDEIRHLYQFQPPTDLAGGEQE